MAVGFLSPEIASLDLEAYMREALLEAARAGEAGELPIGAVVVIDSEVVSRGRARHNEARNQLRHAELNALLAGGERLWRDHRRAILLTTVEPCPLCLGAAVMADVPHIVFGLRDNVVRSDLTLRANPYVRRHIETYHGGVLEEEAARLIERYAPRDLAYMRSGKRPLSP